MDAVVIRPFEGDLTDLAPFVMLSAYLDDQSAACRLLEIEAGKKTRYLVAELGDVLVGAVGIYVEPHAVARLLEPCTITDVAVLASHRRKGIASALITAAEEYVARNGEESVWVSTDGNSPELVAFYIACGYRLAATIPGYWGPGSAKAFFRKDLD